MGHQYALKSRSLYVCEVGNDSVKVVVVRCVLPAASLYIQKLLY